MIGLLINLLIVCPIFGVVWYIVTLLPLPPPFPLIIRLVFLLILLIVVVNLLLGISGGGLWHTRLVD